MLLIVLIVSVIITFVVYLNGKYNEYYWKKRGVAFYKKNKVMGVLWDYLIDDKAFFLHLNNIYIKYQNEPAVGIGTFLTPILYVKDPVNVKSVLITDFNSFNHRGIEVNEDDKLANNILFLYGKKWKLLRQSLSPMFTASKQKKMFYIMDKSSKDFVQFLKENPEIRKGNTFITLSTFCSAAITATVLGVNAKSYFTSPFLKVAQQSFQSNLKDDVVLAISNLSDTLFKLLNINFFKRFEDFFIGAIKQVIRQRERDNLIKHDFADICVSLQKNGKLKDPETGFELEPTDEVLAAQAFFFFIAGVEPTATAMFATLVEIGKNCDILEKIHREIDDTFEKHNGKLSYDIIATMEYLDMALNEAMRMHPSVGFLSRKCVKDTILPVGNIKISKGTKIFIPVFEFQHDPKFFPEPEVFKPDRFSRDNRHKILDITNMTFGKGNRVCVGMRYAQMQAKCGLIYLLRNFTIKTIIGQGGIKYKKLHVQMRLENVDVCLMPR